MFSQIAIHYDIKVDIGFMIFHKQLKGKIFDYTFSKFCQALCLHKCKVSLMFP